MEEHLLADRSHLRRLLLAHPDWPYQEYADQMGRPLASRQTLGQALARRSCH
jgi:hypothetical protein